MQTHLRTSLFLLISLCLFILSESPLIAQEIMGMTKYGGQYGKGVIFKMDENAANREVVFSFEVVGPPVGGFTETAEGIFFGMTSYGGKFGNGAIFYHNAEERSFVTVVDLNGEDTGRNGLGRMVFASNGLLYGMTANGGNNDMGILFELDPDSGVFKKLVDFDGVQKGSNPMGSLIQATDGYIYGMTSTGGEFDSGVLFKMNLLTGEFEKIIDFKGEITGSNPKGHLTETADGMLYGMTQNGGSNEHGVIFQFNPATEQFLIRFEFDGEVTGRNPQGSLTKALNGKLYGLTSAGGENERGTLFEYDPESHEFTKRFDFSVREVSGVQNDGMLLSHPNGKLYGLLQDMGHEGNLIYEFDPEQNTYKRLDVWVVSARVNSTLEKSLTLASNGRIYFCIVGSTNHIRYINILNEFDPYENTITDNQNFAGIRTGDFPHGSLFQGKSGMVYGTTSTGGIFDEGVVFKFDPVSHEYITLHNFDDKNGSTPNTNPVQAANLKLYGLTPLGGESGKGVLYEVDPSSGDFLKHVDFNGINGQYPEGELVKAVNGKLYGVSETGGDYGEGVLFEFDPSTGLFTKLIDFDDGELGGRPKWKALVAVPNGNIFGTISSGGLAGVGKLFAYDTQNGTLNIVLDFDTVNTVSAPLALTLTTDNHLVGISFKFNIEDYTYSILSLSGTSSWGIDEKLLHALNGKFYGMTPGFLEWRETVFPGEIYEVDIDLETFIVLYELDEIHGSNPESPGLIQLKKITPPVAQCRNDTLYLDENGEANMQPSDIDDGSSGDGIELTISKIDFNCDNIGESDVTLTVTDENGNTATCIAVVTVVDSMVPDISCASDFYSHLDPYKTTYEVSGAGWLAEASDNCEVISLTYSPGGEQYELGNDFELPELEAGVHTVTWEATDGSSNVSSCSSVISIEKRPVSLLIIDKMVNPEDHVVHLQVVLLDGLLVQGIAGKPVEFSIDNESKTGVTNEFGVVNIELPFSGNQSDTIEVAVRFYEDATYLGTEAETDIITGTGTAFQTGIRVYPNPFSDRLNIEFTSPETSDARIDLFDPAGRLVATVFNRPVLAGMFYKAEITAETDPPGHYIYVIKIGSFRHSGIVIPLKK